MGLINRIIDRHPSPAEQAVHARLTESKVDQARATDRAIYRSEQVRLMSQVGELENQSRQLLGDILKRLEDKRADPEP